MGGQAIASSVSDIFYSNDMAYIASGCVGAIFLIYCVYNGFYYVFRPAQYQGIRFTTKNIAYITMLSAVSVTVTIVVSITFPITVFPPIRIAFEGLMVKITGYIFGPIVGLMSGVITDALALLFVPSYIHIAYIIVIASFGFLSGCISSFNKAVGRHKFVLTIFINAFLVAIGLFACLVTYYSNTSSIELFKGLHVSKLVLIYALAFGVGGTILLFWITYFGVRLRRDGINKWNDILPIICLAVITEYWVTTFISAWGDIAFLSASEGSSKGYGATMIGRIVMAPPKVAFNTIVIYVTYRAVHGLIHKDD